VSCLAFCNSRRKEDSLAEKTFLLKAVASKRPATASGCGGALATPPTPFFSNLLTQQEIRKEIAMRSHKTVGLTLTAFLFLAGAGIAAARDEKPIERFTAFAAALGTGQTGVVHIDIYRWSTDEERERLLTTLQEFGPDKLLDALEKVRPPVGTIRTATSLSYDLYYARNNPSPDGSRRVILATNRPVSFRELRDNSRRLQYQFTLLEIHIDKNGKGEGKLVPAAKVSWDKEAKKIEIENYNALPVDLLNVTAKTP